MIDQSPAFGTCCKELAEAMESPPNSLFRIEEGVFYLSVGFAVTEKGTGWFDQAVIFCPFCGARLQDRDEVRKQLEPRTN